MCTKGIQLSNMPRQSGFRFAILQSWRRRREVAARALSLSLFRTLVPVLLLGRDGGPVPLPAPIRVPVLARGLALAQDPYRLPPVAAALGAAVLLLGVEVLVQQLSEDDHLHHNLRKHLHLRGNFLLFRSLFFFMYTRSPGMSTKAI